jgi:hypothetical protein
MRPRYGVLATGLFVGVLWGVWHLLQGYWASGVTSGEVSLALWVADAVVGIPVGQLVAYRVLMVWVYELHCCLMSDTKEVLRMFRPGRAYLSPYGSLHMVSPVHKP